VLARSQAVARTQLRGDVEDAAGQEAASSAAHAHEIQAVALSTAASKQRQDRDVQQLADKIAALGEAVAAAKVAAAQDRDAKERQLNASLVQNIASLANLVSKEIKDHKDEVFARVSQFDRSAQGQEAALKALDDKRVDELKKQLEVVKQVLARNSDQQGKAIHNAEQRMRADKLDSQGRLASLNTDVDLLKSALSAAKRELTQQRDVNHASLEQKITEGLELLRQNQTASVQQAGMTLRNSVSAQGMRMEDQLSTIESQATQARSNLRQEMSIEAADEARTAADVLKQITTLQLLVEKTHSLVQTHTVSLRQGLAQLQQQMNRDKQMLATAQETDKAELLARIQQQEQAVDTAREALRRASETQLTNLESGLASARQQLEAEQNDIKQGHVSDMNAARSSMQAGLTKLEDDLEHALNESVTSAAVKMNAEVHQAQKNVLQTGKQAADMDKALRDRLAAVDAREQQVRRQPLFANLFSCRHTCRHTVVHRNT
jgi:hypothetical protein